MRHRTMRHAHQTMHHAQGLPVCVCYNISLTMRLEGSYFAPPVFQKQIKTIKHNFHNRTQKTFGKQNLKHKL